MIHKAIKGFENYLITDTGRVYSLKSKKYLRATDNGSGYLYVNLCICNSREQHYIHRLVAEAFIGNPENKPTVDHINRVRHDNRVENLRWATRSEQAINQSHEKSILFQKQNNGFNIIEVIENGKEIKYSSLREVPNITHRAISNHLRSGETDFIIEQRNGNVRHFIVPKED